ncbi:MAG: transposase [Peptococcaceae bacterium]|nr:transposase [Peptococcaceae bacterium]
MDKKLGRLWERRFKEFESSGKSIAAWCKEHSIKENQFFYWRKKLRSDQPEHDQPVKWLSLGIDVSREERPAGDLISIHVGQAAIEVKKGFDKELLRDILKVLQAL